MLYCKHQPVWQRISRHASLPLISLTVSLLTVPSVDAFDYFEHRYIGNTAYEKARAQLKSERDSAVFIADLDKASKELLDDASIAKEILKSTYRGVPIRFGDLAALAGDHVGTLQNLTLTLNPKEPSWGIVSFFRSMYSEVHDKETERDRWLASRRQWMNMCSWLHNQLGMPPSGYPSLDECATEFLRSEDTKIKEGLESRKMTPPYYPFGGSKGYSPSRSELAQFEELSEYADLASKNESHFPLRSWGTYDNYHRKAITYARYYSGASPPDGNALDLCKDDRTKPCFLRATILYEGFAQHFLHDSFASGHIGAGYYWAEKLHTKQLLQHYHDTFNAIGLDVRIARLPTFPWNDRDTQEVTPALQQQAQEGWTAFGDQHLFIREASFHRFVVIYIATQSLVEVLKVAAGTPPAEDCLMCKRDIFPVIPTDLATGDAPISPLYREGWKLLVTFGYATGQFKDGGGTFDLKKGLANPRKRDTGGVSTFELGYLRNTSPFIPNYWGVGVLLAPGLGRTSYYPLSVGYWFPREASKGFIGFRANLGVRVDEPFTEQNPFSRQAVTGELSMPLDVGYEIYPPVAVYGRLDLFSFNFRGMFPNDFSPHSTKVDSLFGNGAGTFSFGLRIDLAGIVKGVD